MMCRLQRFVHCAWLVAAVVAASMFTLSADAPAGQTRVPDLENRLIDPFQAPSETRAVVLLFLSVDCPISNRYAPEIRRLYETFEKKGVLFWLIYPNRADSSEAIRHHLKAFAYPARALRDPGQALIRLTTATVTPEAAVFDARRTLVYRGRIDDRYVSLGLARQAPTTHDLEEALAATIAGRPVPRARTEAVGCFIADFLR